MDAERVGDHGLVYGVDISDQLLIVAAKRATQLRCVELVRADAELLVLPSNSVDAFFSRFGVMSFENPTVAFSNFHRLLKSDGRLAFCCWRPFQDNELDRFPLLSVLKRHSTKRLSVSSPNYVRSVMVAAGFTDIAIAPYDKAVTSGDADAVTRVLLKVGPLGKIARENPSIASDAEPKLRQALAALGDPVNVELVASIWIVTANA